MPPPGSRRSVWTDSAQVLPSRHKTSAPLDTAQKGRLKIISPLSWKWLGNKWGCFLKFCSASPQLLFSSQRAIFSSIICPIVLQCTMVCFKVHNCFVVQNCFIVHNRAPADLFGVSRTSEGSHTTGISLMRTESYMTIKMMRSSWGETRPEIIFWKVRSRWCLDPSTEPFLNRWASSSLLRSRIQCIIYTHPQNNIHPLIKNLPQANCLSSTCNQQHSCSAGAGIVFLSSTW